MCVCAWVCVCMCVCMCVCVCMYVWLCSFFLWLSATFTFSCRQWTSLFCLSTKWQSEMLRSRVWRMIGLWSLLWPQKTSWSAVLQRTVYLVLKWQFNSWDSRARQVIRKSQGVFLRGMSWLCSGALPARFLSRKLSEWRNYWEAVFLSFFLS